MKTLKKQRRIQIIVITFIASEILAKHDENYMPKEVIDTLKEQGVYKKVNN